MNWTEDEAKTKWCPFVRTGLTAGMAVNRHVADAPKARDGVYDETRCIGSQCMAWRKSSDATEARYEHFSGSKPPGTWELVGAAKGDPGTEDHEWRRIVKPAEPAYGYCGVAGPST